MIDIIGHELRTPATVVKLNVSLLRNILTVTLKSLRSIWIE